MGKKAMPLYGGWVCKKCAVSFANRRQLAFVLDSIVFGLLIYAVTFAVALLLPGIVPVLMAPIFSITGFTFNLSTNFVFNFKDGFRGKSIGRLITGVTVVDEATREPIGFGQSFKRNLCLLVPFSFIVVVLNMMKGPRWGDRWAGTRVVWDHYRNRFPFEDRGYLCRQCGYDLTGNESGRCPECGTAIPDYLRPPLVAHPVVEDAA